MTEGHDHCFDQRIRQFRLFLASPGDVEEERKHVRSAIEQLRGERAFRDRIKLECIAWDQPGIAVPMEAALTPQKAIMQGIPKPSDCDLVIEAATENRKIKFEIFQQLDSTIKSGAILATNTSSISITEIAAVTSRPELVVGMHFMNPVPVMKLVEGIRGLETSNECYDTAAAVIERMGKVLVTANDMPGFAVNRILMPMINEAVYTLHEGVASVTDIDQAMKLGTNQPMGPLELADFIGLDTCLAIMDVLHDGLGDTKYRPCPLLKQYVAAKRLGRKSGRGFYEYN